MSNRTLPLTDTLYDYLLDHSLREPEVMRRLRAETARLPEAEMQIAPEQGQFMALLVRLMGARRALEIGTFTGYSALAVARALPEDGTLLACDISETYTAIARKYWEAAGVAHKIDLRLAPALQTLDALLDDGQAGTFDFAFIDADKESYDAYYERTLRLLRPGGLAVIDNTLRDGRVADPSVTDPVTERMRAFNDKLHHDERIDLSLLPLADGVTLARKR
ncbi:class I SAM-dependent methyltransferase [Rhodocaloribacter litoris]|uniref:class I SAM-dependent methyltransferase n=1 Tax=Rhodocaloribacter litoris TaxID=2558931 RepID=UPI00141D7AAF|nr:class I SAM-dependent methyltransferase [Rhodocaloribacter litoris]QXD14242.1 class I SAM-dependent methyltransferase [Rhodocaloribacter litoris]GIV59883.1 MAG: O-methyltransferase [Rhodothermaceae bacterium]